MPWIHIPADTLSYDTGTGYFSYDFSATDRKTSQVQSIYTIHVGDHQFNVHY